MKTKPCLLVMLLLLWSMISLRVAAQEHTKDTLDTVKMNLMNKKAVLLDVREEKEWKAGHLQQATLLPLSKLRAAADAKSVVKDLDTKQIIYLHCRSGGRCVTAAEALRKMGYDARPLKLGYEDLLKAGLPMAMME